MSFVCDRPRGRTRKEEMRDSLSSENNEPRQQGPAASAVGTEQDGRWPRAQGRGPATGDGKRPSKTDREEFPSSPVVKTPSSQCRGRGFNPWLGN